VGTLVPVQVMFGGPAGSIAQDPSFEYTLSTHTNLYGVSPTIYRTAPEQNAAILGWNLMVNVYEQTIAGTTSAVQDDTTRPSFLLRFNQTAANPQFEFFYAPAGASVAWQRIGVLTPNLGGQFTTASYVYTDQLFGGAGTTAYFRGAGTYFGSADQTSIDVNGTILTSAAPGFHGGLYWGAGSQWSLDTSGGVNAATLNVPTIANNPTFTGNTYQHGTSYFGGGNQSYFDGSGNLVVKQFLGLYSASGAWANVIFRIGADGNNMWEEWTDTNGNLNFGGLVTAGVWRGGPVLWFDEGFTAWFNYQIIVQGNAQHYATCYFGNSNNSYFDSGGSMLCGNASFQARNNNAYFGAGNQSSFGTSGGLTCASALFTGQTNTRALAYFGTGDQAHFNADGSLVLGGSGMNWASAGDGAYHAFKWAAGPFWQAFVNGSIVLSQTPNYCDEAVKRDIQPVAVDALQALRQVELVSYVLVGPEALPFAPRHFDIGFTAQRTRPFVPDAIMETEEGELFLDTMPLVAYLVRAVQQLADRLEALEVKH
jgi:hypothetical protein